MPDFIMVRLPKDLAARVDDSRHATTSREAFVRGAVEAALGAGGVEGSAGQSAGRGEPSKGAIPRQAAAIGHSGQEVGLTAPASPRASGAHIGCERHPDAGAYQGPNGKWWCSGSNCIKAARRQA